MAFFQPGRAKIRRLGVWRTTVRGTGFPHPCGNDVVLTFVRLPWCRPRPRRPRSTVPITNRGLRQSTGLEVAQHVQPGRLHYGIGRSFAGCVNTFTASARGNEEKRGEHPTMPVSAPRTTNRAPRQNNGHGAPPAPHRPRDWAPLSTAALLTRAGSPPRTPPPRAACG